MAQDEGRFGRISSCRRAWAPPKVRPQAPRQVVREYSYVFSAVAPAQGALTSLILPRANTAMMNLFLQHLAHAYANYFIVMQVDQAGWHRATNLVIPDNIRLLPQPAHSPELNPVEHIWDELREKHFHNQAFPSLDAVEETLIEGLNQLASDPERVRSMTYFPHFRNIS
jgi:transposase